MNPILLLVGLPYYTTRQRDKDFDCWFEASETFPGWETRLIWAMSDKVDLRYCWRLLETALEPIEINENGAGIHALMFHKNPDEHTIFGSRLGHYHRFRFLSLDLITAFGSSAFYDAIREEVVIEERWRQYIRPQALGDALILPGPPYFSTTTYFSMIWARVASTATMPDINQLAQDIQDFTSKHSYKGGNAGFKDDHRNVFRLPKTADYHGIAEYPRENWKFTYRLHDGFHFDVGPEKGRGSFKLQTPDGAREFVDNVNVYPHGQLR